MVDEGGIRGGSPLSAEGDAGGRLWHCPPEFAAICGNDKHVYDTRYASLCPGCGDPGRLIVGKVLSDEILHPRLVRALGAWMNGGWRDSKVEPPALQAVER